MQVRDTIRRWLEVLTAVHGPEASAAENAGRLAVLVDEPGRGEGVPPTPGDVAALHGVKDSIPIGINEDIHTILSPTKVQIDSPRRIDMTLLRPFLSGGKEIVLVLIKPKTFIPATLHEVHDTYLIAKPKRLVEPHYKGTRLLVLFPALPTRHYVLQTFVDDVQPHRLKLCYQDPRYDVRRRLQLVAPVVLRVAPPAVISAIEKQQVQPLREITLAAGETPASEECLVADLLYAHDAPQPYASMRLFDTIPPLTCGLKNLSLGGVCLTLDASGPPPQLLHALVLLRIPLPTVSLKGVQLHLTLKPFGAIRGVRTTVEPPTLHIRFLQRLPEEFAILLEHLERRFLKQQSPLA